MENDILTTAVCPTDYCWIMEKPKTKIGSVKNIDGFEIIFFEMDVAGFGERLVAVSPECEIACITSLSVIDIGKLFVDHAPRITDGNFVFRA